MIVRITGRDTVFIYKPVSSSNPNFTYVKNIENIEPEFKGDLAAFVQKEMHYPEDAKRNKIEGTVRTYVYIDKEGKIGDITILHSVYPSLDAEALRLINLMKNWEPAKVNDVAFSTWRGVDIQFKLE